MASVLDDVIISSEEKIRKPARDLYMLALDREFVTAKHALMVGNDERNDIIGANSAGLDAAYFRTEISPAERPGRFGSMRYVRLPEPTTTGC